MLRAKSSIGDFEEVGDETIDGPGEIHWRHIGLPEAAHVEAHDGMVLGDDADPLGEHVQVGRDAMMKDDRASAPLHRLTPWWADVVDPIVQAGFGLWHRALLNPAATNPVPAERVDCT